MLPLLREMTLIETFFDEEISYRLSWGRGIFFSILLGNKLDPQLLSTSIWEIL